jgi:DNA-binding response OmpR family regulator
LSLGWTRRTLRSAVRILLVEDDARTARALSRGLREEGYVVDVAASGEEGEYLAGVNDYCAIVLDWYLPGKDGLAMCRDLRRDGIVTPILMLTARDALADRVAGLDTGVDDYLTKPFAFAELLARLRAVLRRSDLARPAMLVVGDLCMDPATHRVARSGRRVELTLREYQILEVLMRRPGHVIGRAQIEEELFRHIDEFNSNAIEVHISHLRAKIDAGHTVRLLCTVRGRGYYIRRIV